MARPGPWTLERVFGLFPRLKERARSSPAARCRAASSRCWRSAARWRPIRACCCSTSRPRVWRRSSCRSCCAALTRLLREERLAAHRRRAARAEDPAHHRSRADPRARPHRASRAPAPRCSPIRRPLERFLGVTGTVTPIFESFATFEKSFTGRRRYPNIRATALTHKQRAGLEETMIDRMGAWRRRRVLAGLMGRRGAWRAGDPARGALGHAGARWAARCR